MSDLTILCITAGHDYALPFLEQLDDDAQTAQVELRVEHDGRSLRSGGYIESVLDEALERCTTEYVLRVDDDESLSLRMLEWVRDGGYRAARHWAFPRRHFWPDRQHQILNQPLWPDLQTRLSLRSLAGGRVGIHDGSPYGTGRIAPPGVVLEHHKFLVRDRVERELLVQYYETIRPGAGTDFMPFSLPELYQDELEIGVAE